jgi:hypothetical protein
MGFRPLVFLEAGDAMELGIDQLGTRRQQDVAPR